MDRPWLNKIHCANQVQLPPTTLTHVLLDLQLLQDSSLYQSIQRPTKVFQ